MKAGMKKMFFLGAMVVFTAVLYAQNPTGKQKRSPEQIAQKQTEMMTQKLALTSEQQAKVEELNLNYAKKVAQQRDAERKERQEKRKAFKEQMKAKNEELKQILTPEQYQTWKQERKEMAKQMNGKRNKN